MADHSTRIAEIQNILRAGASSITTDGVSVSYDFDSLRRELRQLMAEDDTHAGRRPTIATVDLRNAFGS